MTLKAFFREISTGKLAEIPIFKTWPYEKKRSAPEVCCVSTAPCGEWEGDCDAHEECAGELVCGKDNACDVPDSKLHYSDCSWDVCVVRVCRCGYPAIELRLVRLFLTLSQRISQLASDIWTFIKKRNSFLEARPLYLVRRPTSGGCLYSFGPMSAVRTSCGSCRLIGMTPGSHSN